MNNVRKGFDFPSGLTKSCPAKSVSNAAVGCWADAATTGVASAGVGGGGSTICKDASDVFWILIISFQSVQVNIWVGNQ